MAGAPEVISHWLGRRRLKAPATPAKQIDDVDNWWITFCLFSGFRPQRQRARLLRVEPREGVAREHGLRHGAAEGEHGA